MTHSKFREAIALYWINPEEFMKEKKVLIKISLKQKTSSTHSMTLSATMDTSIRNDTKNSKTGPNPGTNHINDTSLAPNGSLHYRLDAYQDHLLSEMLSSRARCGLYMWLGMEI